MEKILLVVESNCSDPDREDEFNDWYNHTHLPDVFETEGFIRAVRYERIDPSGEQAKYLAFYEIETDDLDAMMKSFRANMDIKRAEGRMSDLLQISERSNLKEIFTASR